MGRTRTKSKKSAPVVLDSPAAADSSQSKALPSISSLLGKAQDLIVQCDYELARLFVQRILQREANHAEAREILGIISLETGELDAAKEVFLSLIPPSTTAPSSPPPSAHLYLAQLSEDDPQAALGYYQAAVDIFMTQLKGKDKQQASDLAEDSEKELKYNIVRALIGMVEIWMDPSYDLCFDPAAEKTCEDLLGLALQTDPDNAEALQALASVRMSQQRPEEAKECVERVWNSLKDMDSDGLPPIPTRLALVKLLLELSLFTPALLVLHGVMAEDDQEVEAWYLEGWCFFLMSEQAKENGGKLDDLSWEELARDSRDCLETCQVLHTNEEHPDTPLLDHVRELIVKLDTLGITPSPAEVEEGESAEDDEWEDEDEDVDMS